MSLKQQAKELLSNPIFHFNNTSVEDEHFPNHIKKLLREYSDVLKNREFWEAFFKVHYPTHQFRDYGLLINVITEFCLEIQKCIDSYYLGKINSAYQHLEKGLNHGISFSSSKLFEESFKLFPAESLNLYRIRQREKQENIEFNRE